jgi:cell wall-associated NlpC family hydrolase
MRLTGSPMARDPATFKPARQRADATPLPRLLLLTALAGFLLALTGPALAAGPPVFAIVPNQSGAPTPAGGSLYAAIRRQLALDRRELAAVNRDRRRLIASAERAEARANAATTTVPFALEDLAGRSRQAAAADAAQATRLRRAIAGLQKALQPVVIPAGTFESGPAAVGAYAVQLAERYLGVRYVWGGSLPDEGFDCSGFVKYVYGQIGIALPHYAASQWAKTVHVQPSELEPGDLVFFEPRADGPGHVGMYVGNGMFIEAPHTGAVVQYQSLAFEASTVGFVGASRPAA